MTATVASASQLAGERGEDEAKYKEKGKKPEDGKVFGIIPQEIKGDFGCLGCKSIRCMYIKYLSSNIMIFN